MHVLPVRVQAPRRAWHMLTDGVAASGGAALRAALAPRPRRIPSFPQCRCTLASSPVGWRFRDRALNLFLALLFEAVPSAAALAGLPPVALSRFDLHHGHLFYTPSCRQLGLLMHGESAGGSVRQLLRLGCSQSRRYRPQLPQLRASCPPLTCRLPAAQEYPAAHAERFPFDLGNCQRGSTLQFDERAMDCRNLLW